MVKDEFLLKILIIGDSGVGKSCLLRRFTDDTFENDFISTIGVDFKMKNIKIDNKKVKLQIWDTAGQERFHTITSSYYRGAHGIIVVYDTTQRDSFESVGNWFKQIETNASSGVVSILVGNKKDEGEHKAVLAEEGKAYAEKRNIEFLETSAKNGESVEEMFQTICNAIFTSGTFRSESELNREAAFDALDFDEEQQGGSTCCP